MARKVEKTARKYQVAAYEPGSPLYCFGDNLKKAIAKKGYSQRALAKALNLNDDEAIESKVRLVNNWANHRGCPTPSNLLEIAAELQPYGLDYLFGIVNDAPNIDCKNASTYSGLSPDSIEAIRSLDANQKKMLDKVLNCRGDHEESIFGEILSEMMKSDDMAEAMQDAEEEFRENYDMLIASDDEFSKLIYEVRKNHESFDQHENAEITHEEALSIIYDDDDDVLNLHEKYLDLLVYEDWLNDFYRELVLIASNQRELQEKIAAKIMLMKERTIRSARSNIVDKGKRYISDLISHLKCSDIVFDHKRKQSIIHRYNSKLSAK